MPVRFLLYVAITAITRHTVDIMAHPDMDMMKIVWASLATLVFTVSVLIIRIASSKFPGARDEV